MRILLIDIVRTSIEDVWPSVEHSLGLLSLTASARRRLGDRVDIRVRTLVSRTGFPRDERERLAAWLEEDRPDVVGFRCLSIGKDVLYDVAADVREWREDCRLLVGGPHPTDAPEEVLRATPADCVVIGEGEETFVELLERFGAGAPWRDTPGIAVLEDGRYAPARPRPPVEDLDSLPRPDWSAVDLDAFSNRYLTFSSKIGHRHGNLLTTRGCPYGCLYCHAILGKRFRARSPGAVVEEIRELHDRYGLTDFQILDDIFNFDSDRAKRICAEIAQSRLRVTLSFPNGVRGDRMDDELIERMAEAGTRFVSYAVETASPRLQKLIRKNLDLDKTFRAIERTARAGIITRGFFMLGFPSETEDEVRATLRYAAESSLTGATFFTVVYFPGTGLYRLARSMGYFLDRDAEVRRDYVEVGDGPYEFDASTLVDLKRRGLREFAFTRSRVENALRVLPGYFNAREIGGFFLAYIVSAGIRSESEFEDEWVRRTLGRHVRVARRFSREGAFYV